MSEAATPEVNDAAVQQDELAVLKTRADKMGITYHPSIGLDKLREKVNGALVDQAPDTTKPAENTAGKETDGQRRARLIKEASALVRIRVTCMNPNKKEWEGDLFTVSNSVVGTFKKYVPFNAEDGWHVPNIIYKQIKARKCQVFSTVRDNNGNKMRKGKLINEFSIEVLDPLTPEELEDLARKQAMANSID